MTATRLGDRVSRRRQRSLALLSINKFKTSSSLMPQRRSISQIAICMLTNQSPRLTINPTTTISIFRPQYHQHSRRTDWRSLNRPLDTFLRTISWSRFCSRSDGVCVSECVRSYDNCGTKWPRSRSIWLASDDKPPLRWAWSGSHDTFSIISLSLSYLISLATPTSAVLEIWLKMCHVTLTTPISGVVCHPKLVILTLTWVISLRSYHTNAHTQTHKHRHRVDRSTTTARTTVKVRVEGTTQRRKNVPFSADSETETGKTTSGYVEEKQIWIGKWK